MNTGAITPVLTVLQSGVLTIGEMCQIQVEVTASSGVPIKTDSFEDSIINPTSIGVHTFVGVADRINLEFVRIGSNVNITLTALSLRQQL